MRWFFWLLLCAFIGYCADRKGRNMWAWGLAALFLSPLIVGIVLALMHNPELIIMDEPTSGLDPIMQNVFYELLREEKEKGNTVFYSTHILSEVSKVCDRVGIIRNGELIRAGSVDEISDKQLAFVTVSADDIDALVAELGVKVLSAENDTVRFANTVPDDELIKKLSHFRIRKILIEEATLEEMFMHYYEEER